MSPAEILVWAQLVGSLGVGAGGMGLFRWGFNVERRLLRLEYKNKVTA